MIPGEIGGDHDLREMVGGRRENHAQVGKISIRIAFFLLFVSFLPSPAWGISKKITSPDLKPSEISEPIKLEADQLEYKREEDLFLADGAVVVTQGPMRIESDSLSLNQATGQLLATGNVRFNDGENAISSERLEIDVNTKLGVLYEARLFVKSENYHIKAAEMERESADRYSLKEASFTSCDCPENPEWQIRSRRMRLHLEDYLVIRDLTFYAGKVPILYLPYFIYPTSTERQTGLLVPLFGYNSRWGAMFRQEFFWAISKSQDLTLFYDRRGTKGQGGGLEYRYILSRKSQGTLQVNHFNDKEQRVGRWELRYNHEERFTDRISAKINIRYITQNNYYQELSRLTADRASQNIESNFLLSYRGDASVAYILARYTQNLTAGSNNTTAQRLPEIGYSLLSHRLGSSPLYFNFDSTAVYFWRTEGVRAQRLDLFPKLSMPISLSSFGTVTPWAGIRETWYSRGETEEKSIHREIFPAGLTWENLLSKEWENTAHQIVPSFMYESISVRDRSDIPQFDAVDRLRDRNSVTASLLQRLLKRDETGGWTESASFRLTQSYRLEEARSNHSDRANRRPFSDLRGQGTLRLSTYLSFGVDTFYSLYERFLSSWNTDLTFHLPPYITATLGQRYSREGVLPQKGDLFNPLYIGDRETAPRISFWTERIVIRTPWGIQFASRAYFDVDQSKFVEISYGLKYERQCWGITLAYIDLRTRNEFTFMISLKGLGEAGSQNFANLF
ncbi:MAG: LPS assembly protein LptD [Candidatus Manganitrophaceae bacterium]